MAKPKTSDTSLTYSWFPPGISNEEVHKYFLCLPSDKVPRKGTHGARAREVQLMLQLPQQDLALSYCQHISEQDYDAFEAFVNQRNEHALDIGHVKSLRRDKLASCGGCRKIIARESVAVIAPRLQDRAYHPGCFVCSACHELLVDLTYCVRGDKLFCERHYAETYRPRCFGCDELIFSSEYTRAMNREWHLQHFACVRCRTHLTGQKYVLRDTKPFCVSCYEKDFTCTCAECDKPIGLDSKDLSYKDRHWHETCFVCAKCRVSLVDQPFGWRADRAYCATCYDATFALRCTRCGQSFKAGTKKMEYRGKHWHDTCFTCTSCGSSIGTSSFVPKDDDIFCRACFEAKYAKHCVTCNGVVIEEGIEFKDRTWHKDCFVCTSCQAELMGQRFISRDEGVFCIKCYSEKFAKKCAACGEAIVGGKGTRFVTFEDRSWHNTCFKCSRCEVSLVGAGFIVDADEIVCSTCAQQQLANM